MTGTMTLLSTQHQEVLARLTCVEAEMTAPQRSDLAAFAAYLSDEVAHHFALEEGALFPLLAHHLSPDYGPLGVMNAEHAAFRELLGDLTTAVHAGNHDAQRAHAVELIELLRGHIAKEDHVLFPLALRLLSSAELSQLDELGRTLDGAPLTSA